MGQIGHGAVDLAPCIVKVGASHQWCGARQSPTSTLGNGQHHIQIA